MFWGQFTDWWYQKFKQNLILNEITEITEIASNLRIASSPLDYQTTNTVTALFVNTDFYTSRMRLMEIVLYASDTLKFVFPRN